ncbi:isochorismatase family protein [Nocardia sp.]|uniref:isochorismatase family protein n=1 Tax=Nocardia sp. TaxID=1821 RepID=UPI0025853837|nr:isochorismatase family protein [Nocardia sp.]
MPVPDDLAADYATAGFGGELTPGTRPALILVDPARAYVDPGCSLYAGVDEPVRAMRVLLAAARGAGIPVVVTEVRLRADGADAGHFFRKSGGLVAFCEGSPFADFIEGLAPNANEFRVTKSYPSAFFGTTLHSYLTAFNGPNHDQDPGDKGYIFLDGLHPNDTGHRVIAEHFRSLGYDPLQ